MLTDKTHTQAEFNDYALTGTIRFHNNEDMRTY